MGFIAADKWMLEDALRLVREIQPGTRKYQYHLCMGGGVLNNGHSKKDLDLYFLPMTEEKKLDNRGLVTWISGLWGKPERFWAPLEDDVIHPPVYDEPRNGYHVWLDQLFGYDFMPMAEYEAYMDKMKEYKDIDHKTYSFKGKFLYGGLRIDAFVMGGDPLDGDEWYKSQGEDAPDLNQRNIIYDPPPIEGGLGDRLRG